MEQRQVKVRIELKEFNMGSIQYWEALLFTAFGCQRVLVAKTREELVQMLNAMALGVLNVVSTLHDHDEGQAYYNYEIVEVGRDEKAHIGIHDFGRFIGGPFGSDGEL